MGINIWDNEDLAYLAHKIWCAVLVFGKLMFRIKGDIPHQPDRLKGLVKFDGIKKEYKVSSTRCLRLDRRNC